MGNLAKYIRQLKVFHIKYKGKVHNVKGKNILEAVENYIFEDEKEVYSWDYSLFVSLDLDFGENEGEGKDYVLTRLIPSTNARGSVFALSDDMYDASRIQIIDK